MLTSRRKRPKTLWHTEHRVPFGICLWVDVLMVLRHSRFNNNWITRTSTMLVLLLSLGGVVATSVPLINQKTFGHVSNHRVRLSCAEPHGLCCFPKPFYNFYLLLLFCLTPFCATSNALQFTVCKERTFTGAHGGDDIRAQLYYGTVHGHPDSRAVNLSWSRRCM